MKTEDLFVAELCHDTIREAVAPFTEESPIMRLAMHGERTLSDAELVSIITDMSVDDARVIVEDGLRAVSRREWRFAASDTTPRQAQLRMAAVLELGRRVAAIDGPTIAAVGSPDAIGRGLVARYGHLPQEHLICIFLDSRNVVLAERVVFIGTVNSASVSTREPLRMALELHAVGIIVAHNHPTGDPSPSADDYGFTTKLQNACKHLDIQLLDHVVVGSNRFVSFKQRDLL